MDKATFKSIVNVGGDPKAVNAALAEAGYASIDAVPENDRQRFCAKVLSRSAAFASKASRFRKANDLQSFARNYWDQHRPQAERPADWDEVTALAWKNLKGE